MTAPTSAAWIKPISGLALCLALAAAAMYGSQWHFFKETLHWGPLLLVIVAGMAVRSLWKFPAVFEPGVALAQKPVMRLAVAGLGFRLSLPELAKIGIPSLVVVLTTTVGALAFGWWIARKLGIGEKLGLLLGVGGAICGASAVVAADTVVQGEKRDSAYALGIITFLGTIGILFYPWLGRQFAMSEFFYGVWNGATLHEMAQVVAAGANFGPEALKIATVVKLARICLLAPVVFYLAWDFRRRQVSVGDAKVPLVPWFLVVFMILVLVTSFANLPKDVLEWLRGADLWLLCIGMAGVGLQTGFRDLKAAGWRPILAGSLQWLVLALSAYGLALVLKI